MLLRPAIIFIGSSRIPWDVALLSPSPYLISRTLILVALIFSSPATTRVLLSSSFCQSSPRYSSPSAAIYRSTLRTSPSDWAASTITIWPGYNSSPSPLETASTISHSPSSSSLPQLLWIDSSHSSPTNPKGYSASWLNFHPSFPTPFTTR
jgi:hypothetical protein